MDADRPQKIPAPNALVWDCGSSLYDSAELKSFRLQLDAALASRCFSMPHLASESDLRQPPPPPAAGSQMMTRRRLSSRFSRTVQKLIRSVLRMKPASVLRRQPADRRAHQHALYGMCSDTGVVLASIPEVCEKDLGSPEQQSYSMAIGKAASERFGARTAAVVALTAMA